MKETVRINFEFPRDDYPKLKMICAEKGVSLKDFATGLILQAMEDHDHLKGAKETLKRLRNSGDDMAITESTWKINEGS